MHVHVLCELSYSILAQCSRVGVTGMKLNKQMWESFIIHYTRYRTVMRVTRKKKILTRVRDVGGGDNHQALAS